MTQPIANRTDVPRALPKARPFEDPVSRLTDILTIANTMWLRWTYPFVALGRGLSIHYSCDIRRCVAAGVAIGDNVYLAHHVWLNVPMVTPGAPPAISIGNGCRIGRRCMFTAINSVRLEDNVLVGPGVLIADHGHEFSDIDTPILAQGVTPGGTVLVEKNAWLGYSAKIVCSSGNLVIGRNSVVAANAMVTRSVPPFCVVAGNPATIIKRYDPESGKWVVPQDR